jgi:hypothetical protein
MKDKMSKRRKRGRKKVWINNVQILELTTEGLNRSTP